MKTIDRDNLASVTGGVMDSGDGQGCTRSGGCIPSPFPRPRPPISFPGGEPGAGIDTWRPPLGSGWPNGIR